MKKWIALIAGIIIIGSYIHYFPSEKGSQSTLPLTLIWSEEYESSPINTKESDTFHYRVYPREILPKLGYTEESSSFRFKTEGYSLKYVYSYPHYYTYDLIGVAQKVIVKKYNNIISEGTGNTPFVFDKLHKYEVYWKVNVKTDTGITGYHIIRQIYKYVPQVSLVQVTTTAIVFQTDIPFYLKDNTVRILDGIINNQTKIIQNTDYTFAIVGLTPNTRYRIGYGDKWSWKEIIISTLEKPPPNTIIVDKTTPTSITFRSNIENFLQYYNVEIYDKNSFTKLDKPITQDSTYTFTISELTPDTEYRIVYGNKEIFVTTPKEQETLDIIPLGTEKTSNSFVQVYKVTGENVNQKIQLKHGDKVWNYEPQFDGKNYYVVFDGLETGDYEYTITVYNATEEKRYSNSFHIQNVENPSGIDLDVEPARIDQNSFYLRFRVKGTDDYEAYFEYLNEDTFEVQEAEINHGVRYDDVYLKNLKEGDYSYNLIITTEKGTIEHKGTFTIRKEEQPTYIPPYTPQSEKKSIFPYLVVIIIIFLITYIFIKPKIINSKKRRR